MKKFLSLILALVMATALLTVGANAWTDDDSNKYIAEVKLTMDLGINKVIADSGAFNPDSKVSRGWACRAAAYAVLGPDAAEALPKVTCFKDVDATHSNAAYINWCKEQGIVSGYADGTFNPGGFISRDAALKIMLGALGYKASEQGYNKPGDWRYEVLTDAAATGIMNGITIDNVVEIHRDEFAKLAVNTLYANTVAGTPRYMTSYPTLK